MFVLKCPFLIYLFPQLEEQQKRLGLILKAHLILPNVDDSSSGEAPDGARCPCARPLLILHPKTRNIKELVPKHTRQPLVFAACSSVFW